eukprot:SAG31_NODE_4599_length_3104_cov_4.379368_1_plen_121_part_00
MVAAGIAPLVLLVFFGAVYRAEVTVATIRFSDWLQSHGNVGKIVYVAAFVVYMVLCGCVGWSMSQEITFCFHLSLKICTERFYELLRPSAPVELVGGFCYPLPSAILLNGTAKWLGVNPN